MMTNAVLTPAKEPLDKTVVRLCPSPDGETLRIDIRCPVQILTPEQHNALKFGSAVWKEFAGNQFGQYRRWLEDVLKPALNKVSPGDPKLGVELCHVYCDASPEQSGRQWRVSVTFEVPAISDPQFLKDALVQRGLLEKCVFIKYQTSDPSGDTRIMDAIKQPERGAK
ncbi:MAG: hypothetical protein AB7U41_06420 [Dongiaceae bacterium]